MNNLRRLFASALFLSAPTLPAISATTADLKPTPKPVLKAAGAFSSPDNAALPASRLIPQRTIVASAARVASQSAGVVTSVNFTSYGRFLSWMHQGLKDFSVSPDRQVYVVDVALPNGIRSHGAKFGPNAEQHVVIDAETERYISLMIRGISTGTSAHPPPSRASLYRTTYVETAY